MRYTIIYGGEFIAAFTNSPEAEKYIEDKMNDGGFNIEDFCVSLNDGSFLAVNGRWTVEVG